MSNRANLRSGFILVSALISNMVNGYMHRTSAKKISFYLMLTVILVVGIFHLATPFLTILFSILMLELLSQGMRRWLSVVVFLVLITGSLYILGWVLSEAATSLPQIVQNSVPRIIDHAKDYNLSLPFSDLESLKTVSIEWAREQSKVLAQVAGGATREFVFIVIGLVVAISIFWSGQIDLSEGSYSVANNLYSAVCREVSIRFRVLFSSFRIVMGAQLVIATINTVCTAIFIIIAGIPYHKTIIFVTWFCGLLPIVGNLISNTIIFSVALTKSLQLAFASLLFLIALHKAEYFLNSKIIGGRIKNPMWLTLIGLIVGERLMGIPGMILAPVLLHYVKSEASQIEIKH